MDKVKRIIVDTQSNRLFVGVEMEQNYDQRGGLCQVGEGNVIITTNEIDLEYLKYWQSLGFTMPHLIQAGPFDPNHTLSELIINKPDVQRQIKEIIKHDESRLEFFCIEETERELSKTLGIPGYCNFNVSLELSRKISFKETCKELSLPTPNWFFDKNKKELAKKIKAMAKAGKLFLVKANDGTGGAACGGTVKVGKEAEAQSAIEHIHNANELFFIEELVDKAGEVSLHWEIDENGSIKIINIFNQLAKNYTYAGVSYPPDITDSLKYVIESQLVKKLGPYLVEKGARGFFCCDILIDDKDNIYWIDFNPRKGAILYVWDMVSRISKNHFNSNGCFFIHEHLEMPNNGAKYSFSSIKQKVEDIIHPGEKPFIVLTNPGVMKFGYVDITGISVTSIEEAEYILEQAKKRLLS